jgi:xylulokinase
MTQIQSVSTPPVEVVTIGVDIGSSGVKVLANSRARGVLGTATAPVELTSPEPGWAQADPEEWWEATCRAMRQVLDALPAGTPISAVAVSGMVPAVVCVDTHGRPQGPGLLQNDARATREIVELSDELAGVDLLGRTGSVLSQQSVAPTVRWLQRNEPDRWAATRFLVGSYDYIAMRMGAAPHVELNWAIESGLFDLAGEPVEPVWEAIGLRPDRVPSIVRPGHPVGTVRAAAAEDLGLPEGTAIVVGGADHVMSAYAAGLAIEGDVLVKLGGAGDILAVANTPVTDPRLYLDAHPAPDLWLPNGCMATSGSMLRWLQSIHGRQDLEQLDEEASQRPPAALVALPYLLGEKTPHHDPWLRGVILGAHLGTTAADLHRATLEAIAYGFRQHVEVLREVGVAVTTVRVTNGGSRSVLWKQILADVLDMPLIPVRDHPGASLGAALAGSVQAPEDWKRATSGIRDDPAIEPHPGRTDRYAEAYQIFLDLQDKVNPLARRLAHLAADTDTRRGTSDERD